MFKLGLSRDKPQEITISNRTVLRVLLLVFLAAVSFAAIKQATHALILIFVSFFLALAFNSPVSWVARHLPKKKRGSRALATGIAGLFVVLVIGSFLASIVPPIVHQSSTFVESAPQLVHDLQNENTAVGKVVARYKLNSQIDKLSGELTDRLKNASGAAVTTLSQVGSSVFAALTVLALTFMMLIEGPHWIDWAKRFTPKARRDDADEIVRRMYRVVKGYVNGQVTLAAIAAMLILPMLFILHIPYPFALLFIVFICGLIPMIGHTIGAIIVTLVALTTSFGAALIILGYYILYQQIENYVVQPRVQANSTDMSPLLVFTAVVIGVNFSGLLGGLVAIPIMGCLRVSVLYWLEHREQEATQPTDNA